MKKNKEVEEEQVEETPEGFTVQQRAAGLAIMLAQLYQEDIYTSPEAKTFNVGEPGVTYFAIEKAINTWNAVCVENMATQSNRLILLCRSPKEITGDEKLYERLREACMNAQGMELALWPVRPGQEGLAWHAFGPYLSEMLAIEDENERKQILNMYFGTYPEMDERF